MIRPCLVLSRAVSLDGYLGDPGAPRFVHDGRYRWPALSERYSG